MTQDNDYLHDDEQEMVWEFHARRAVEQALAALEPLSFET
jgi:hypothetical protein